jgi:hypothetical protein
MRIEQLLEQNKRNSQLLLQESCDGLTNDQRLVVEGIYNELSPLLEVALTADQIKNIFQSVEKNATAAGGNRTGLGKGVDTARQVDAALNKLGKWLQDTTPVKNFDAKFEKLKANINKKFPDSKFLDGVSKMGIWAQNNPGKTAAIIGVLTTVAALAGGPVGGAIAGQILKGSVELLKGEKLSTAIGKGAKAAVYGFIAGKSLEEIGKVFQSGLNFVADKMFPGLEHITHIHNNQVLWDVKLASQDAAKLETLTDAASKAMFARDPNYINLLNKASKFVSDTVNQPGYYDKIVANAATAEKFINAGNAAAQTLNGIGAAAQGAVTAKTGEKKESGYLQARSLSEGQVYMLFNRIEQLNEGPIWDKVKSGAGKLAAAAGQKISTVGTNLTTKITADKLNSAWTKAGSPTDSEALAKFLKSQGVDDAVISQTFKAMKLKVGDSAQTGYAQVRAQLAQLNTKQKKQLAAYLQKQLGTA